ncbi:MAG: hypothetical protein ACOYO1_20610 [Bacteroidales bacterium]
MPIQKSVLIFLFILQNLNTNAQFINLGAGLSYEKGIDFDETSTYKNLLSLEANKSGLLSLDLFVKIPLYRNYCLRPAIFFTLKERQTKLENTDGSYLIEGNTISLPYLFLGKSDYYSKEYDYKYSKANISQTSIGFFITNFISYYNFEIGTGLFLKLKFFEVNDYKATDKYIYSSSSEMQYDTYNYLETNIASLPFQTKSFNTKQLSIPLTAQYTNYIRSFFWGISFTSFLGNDSYFSIRFTIGLNYELHDNFGYTRKIKSTRLF